MRFEKVLPAFREGRAIYRRKNMAVTYRQYQGELLGFYGTEKFFKEWFSVGAILADDWEVVE